MNTTKTSAGTEQGNPVVAHVLWMQSDLQERLKVVKRLQDAISSREAEIAESRAKVPDLSHRGAEREDLAASVAIGEAPESALRDLDALIAAERKEAGELKARADEIAADASQVISGLHRKLQVENAALAEAQGEMARAQRAMVRSEAELACQHYVETATAYAGAFLRMHGLVNLLTSLGEKHNLQGLRTGDLILPSFGFEACRAKENPGWPGVMYNFQFEALRPGFIASLATAERSRFEAAGVSFITAK